MSEENQTQQNPETSEEKKQGPSELDLAAYDIEVNLPRVLNMASGLKLHQLYRVFSMVVQYPLIKDEQKFKTKKEAELFFLTLKVLSSKSKILKEFKYDEAEIQDEAVSGMVDELKNKLLQEATKNE